MKLKNKIFIIALFLSLIFSVSAVASAENIENITFQQGNMEDVSLETSTASSNEIEEIKEDTNEIEENENEVLHATEEDVLSETKLFTDMYSKIYNANPGDTIYLNGDTYFNNMKYNTLSKINITIVGGSSLNDDSYAKLEGGGHHARPIMEIRDSDSLTFKNIIFTHGARFIGINSCKKVTFDNCIFESNSNNTDTILLNKAETVEFKNTCFKNNCIGGENTQIALITASAGIGNLKITNCNFTNNQCRAINTYCPTTILNSRFTGHIGRGNGSVFELRGNCSFHVSNCTFYQNTAPDKGGVIYANAGSNLTVENSTFIQNTAINGGAVYSQSSNNKFINNEFMGNTAGSTIYAENNLLLQENKIYSGGGIYAGNLNLIGESITVLKNTTLRAFEGTIKLDAEILPANNEKYSSDNFTFIIGNKSVTGRLDDNVAEVDFDATVKDSGATVTVNMPKSTVKPGKLEIAKYNVSIDFNDTTGHMGTAITIPVYVYDSLGYNLNGKISAHYNGNEKTVNLTDGKAYVEIDLPNYETNIFLLILYGEFHATHQVTVVNPNTPINTSSIEIRMAKTQMGYLGADMTIPVTVWDNIGENPVTGNITVNISGNIQTLTLNNGKADIKLTLPTTPTTLNLTVSYKDTKISSEILVVDPAEHVNIELEETINANISSILEIPVRVYDNDNNPLTGNINIKYDGHQKVEALDSAGKAKIVINLPNNPTVYELIVSYHGVEKKSRIIVADPARPHNSSEVIIVMPEAQSGHVGKTLIIPVRVYDGEGNSLNGNIHVAYNGHEELIPLTSGEATIVMTLPNTAMTYDLTVQHNEKKAVCQINVVAKNDEVLNDNEVIIELEDITAHIGESIKIPVYIHDLNANPLAGQFKSFNGIWESTHTLKNGRAEIPLSLPTTPATIEFRVLYEGILKTVKITVVDPNNPMGDVNEIKSDNGTLVIDFPKDATGDVIITIDGKEYPGRIIDGKVVLDVNNLEKGSYNASVYYYGDTNYPSSTKTITITVTKESNNNNNNKVPKPPAVKKASKITAKKKTFKKSLKVKKYSITLKSGKKAIKKVKVTLKIGKKTYKAKTNSKGKATFKIKKLTKKGKYKAVIKFAGNKSYKPTSKKVKITVK